ncbi:proline-, glutamic acid- and leucine-rich protein 1-like [Neodiprion fabricii]|uniref:proline-, glutamic acid- and leucine-rich protein 1-like n=1 Tax=Neodiprion fabricii TaxID=2872261 RepID=UPI001ED974FD|nr:proline-, glutamic acid- and leucine-rich protein 1-like [Neodiprion fabricii]XP_046419531.1 proline-, glutamic acid- and leucine-rich protein 1-like [Neodiprion fabricii]
MADILNLISTSNQNNDERYKFIQDLLVYKSDVPFDKDEVNAIQNSLLSLINNHLNHAATRHEGLKLLLKTLPRCSRDVLLKHAMLWMTKALQSLEAVQNEQLQVTTAAKVVATLAISCKTIPELQKQISMQNVKQIITHANNLPDARRFGAIFYLVAVLLYHYPEPCERLQVTIRKLILPLVDSGQDNLVNAGARCFALLTAATERSFQPIAGKANLTAWTHSQILICNSLHETMDDLFSGVAEIEHIDIGDKLTLPIIPQTDMMLHYLGLERRFNNLCIYLGITLRGCGSKNSVSPSNIFKILSRGLFITPAGLGNENAFRKQILHLILPNLHSSLLHVLDAFVLGFGKELVPYAQTILQLLHQVLTWTKKTTENTRTLGGTRPFKNIRIRVYKSLSTWLMHAGVLSGVENVCEELLSHILKDIVPEKDRVVLSVQKTHNMSKRALKRHRESQFDNNMAQTNILHDSNPLVNADLVDEALVALQNIFLNTGCRMKASFYESSESTLVALLHDCYLETHEETFYKRCATCRLNLVKALKMLQLNPHPLVPPPTQYCLEIFQMAQNDADTNVSHEAKIALAEIEKIAHPAAPTLRLPIVVDLGDRENEPIELDFAMDSNMGPKTAHTSSPNNEDRAGHSPSPILEDPEDESLDTRANLDETNLDTNNENQENVSELDSAKEKRMSDSTAVEIILISITEQVDDSRSGDDSRENTLDDSTNNKGDPSHDTAEAADADEPQVKRQNIEITESVSGKTADKPQGEIDSEDDAAMLDSFCDAVQGEK